MEDDNLDCGIARFSLVGEFIEWGEAPKLGYIKKVEHKYKDTECKMLAALVIDREQKIKELEQYTEKVRKILCRVFQPGGILHKEFGAAAWGLDVCELVIPLAYMYLELKRDKEQTNGQ